MSISRYNDNGALEYAVTQLRTCAGENHAIEAKSGAAGFPNTLEKTLCAFANHPSGGLIIIGLDENDDFNVVPIKNPHAMAQQLVDKARAAYLPPITTQVIADARVDGRPVVAVQVLECPSDQKPCRLKRNGTAYLRAYDGDYSMSPLEEQGFLQQRHHPNTDTQPVAKSRLSDLDTDLVDQWRATVRELDPQGLGKLGDDSMLIRGGVCTEDGVPTVAGILALGVYPQQFFPGCIIHAAVTYPNPAIRATHNVNITGPLPVMLSRAMDWARDVFAPAIMTTLDGHAVDSLEFPLVAFREIIANALIHRDYSQWALGTAIEVRRLPDRLTVFNPGGLHGISVTQLGIRPVTSARNLHLLSICKFLQVDDGREQRMIEALSQGIPLAQHAMARVQLPLPIFDDTGIGFTAILRNQAEESKFSHYRYRNLTAGQRKVIDAITKGAHTLAEIAVRTSTKEPNARRIVYELLDLKLVTSKKIAGERAHRYSLVD